MSYPDSLMYYANALRGVSTNVFRVNAQTTGNVGANQTIRFELPSNTLLNLRNTRLQMNVACSGTGDQRLPPLHLLLQRVSVLAGGIPIDSGCNNLPVITQVLRNMRPDDCDKVVEHDNIYRNVSQDTYGKLGGTQETGITVDGTAQYNISLGTFFDSVSPGILATDILPSLQVEIFLSNSSVILSSAGVTPGTGATFVTAGTADGSFTVSNYHLVCPCIAIGDKGYEMMIDSAMSRNKYVPVMYHQYYNFSSTYTGDAICSNGSECLNKLIAVFRKTNYNASGLAPLIRSGFNNEDGVVTARGTPVGAGGAQGSYFQGDGYAANESYISPQLKFNAPTNAAGSLLANNNLTAIAVTGVPRLNWRVSNVMMPNYQVPLLEWYMLSKQAMDVSRPTNAKSMFEFMEDQYVVAQALNLPNTSVRLKCGADMRGSTSQIRLEANNTTNLSPDHNIEIFLQCTSELRIGQGMDLQVFN